MQKKHVVLLAIFALILGCWPLAGCQRQPSLSIVIPAGADAAAAEQVQEAFREQWGEEIAIRADDQKASGGKEILIGMTNREASSAASKTLRPKDFAITFSSDKVVILGGGDEATAQAVRYFVANYLDYYVEANVLPDTEDANYFSSGNYPIKTLTLDGASISEYVIVTKDGAPTKAAQYLQQQLSGATGYELTVASPANVAEGARAIAFGSSGFRSSGELSGSLAAQECLLKSVDETLYLCAGTEDDELFAAKLLVNKLLQFEPVSATAPSAEVELANVNLKLTTALGQGDTYEALSELVFTLPTDEAFTVFQGGCTDGRYAYYIMNDQSAKPYTSRVYKVDTSTWKLVAKSERLTLEHANSVTYNAKLKRLVVSNYEPTYNALTIVNPDTLTIDKVITVGFNTLNISYYEPTDRYAIGLRDTYDFVITDGEFNVLKFCKGVNTDYIKQEADADGDYIYFIQSDENHIIVHDWDGNFVSDIALGFYVESENMIHVDGQMYVGYFSNGGLVYKTTPYRDITPRT